MAGSVAVNQGLRRALAEARLRNLDVADRLSVDAKTVQRWLAGRLPQPIHRQRLAQLVDRHEFDLWPQLTGARTVDAEIVAAFAHRSSVPREVWREFFVAATSEIGVLVYSGLFLAEDVELVRLLRSKAADGVRVRLALGDPEAEAVRRRGVEEGIGDAMTAKVRNSLVLLRPLVGAGVELRLHDTVLYNSIFRADGELLVNQHVYGIGAAFAPVLRLRAASGEGLTQTYVDSFERVWSTASVFS